MSGLYPILLGLVLGGAMGLCSLSLLYGRIIFPWRWGQPWMRQAIYILGFGLIAHLLGAVGVVAAIFGLCTLRPYLIRRISMLP
jgi:hypothetical protein